MTSSQFNDEVDASAVLASEVKARECAERQEEMDAIAAFRDRSEFLPVSAAYVRSLPAPVANSSFR